MFLHRLSLLLVALWVSSCVALPRQVSKTAECEKDGTPDTSSYRQAVPVPGTPHFLPVYSSVDLSQPLSGQGLLIFVHGIGGNANTFFCDALKAVPRSVGVIAPWFGDETVQLQTWAGKAAASAAGNDHTSLFWSSGKWNQGAAAANAPPVASFDALDAIISLVSASKNGGSGGGLTQVVVAGFSAGAQLVQRYAWATTYGTPSSSPRVKFVVSDPSTYLYFDDQRPDASCRYGPGKQSGALVP